MKTREPQRREYYVLLDSNDNIVEYSKFMGRENEIAVRTLADISGYKIATFLTRKMQNDYLDSIRKKFYGENTISIRHTL